MTIQSMTGYGAGESVTAHFRIAVEVKSVNNRFLDFVFRLPPLYSKFEPTLAEIARQKLKRGRVDIWVNRSVFVYPGQNSESLLNESLFNQYTQAYFKAFALMGLDSPEAKKDLVLDVLRRKDVLGENREGVLAGEDAGLKEAFEQAIEQLLAMRLVEGQALLEEVLRIVSSLDGVIQEIASVAQQSPRNYQERLMARLSQFGLPVEFDSQRILQEVALFADRADITEELTRVRSHLQQVQSVLANGGGRKLEFLLQELGREINTIGSKSQSLSISEQVVEGKALLEKLREQVLNVE